MRKLTLTLLGFLLACALVSPLAAQQTGISLSTTRQAASDLEINAAFPGQSANTTRYISYASLLKLPQVKFTASPNDENFATGFTQPVVVTGVRLESLAAALGIDLTKIMPVAICADGYRANYPASYIAAHHPVLVLTVNGLPPEKWPRSHYGDVMAPYIISHDTFVPAFHVLSHADEMQIPYAVVLIEFRNQQQTTAQQTYAAITPPGNYAPDSPVMRGFAIAKQNCFRCHNNGDAGGTMAHHPWQVLAAWAAYQPDYFTQYVRNPASLRTSARMPGNPGYDDATLDALRQYFATFSTKVSAKK